MGWSPTLIVSITTCLLSGSIVGFIVATHFHNKYSSPPKAFAVAVDAGSTHTDFSIYTWKPVPSDTAPVVLVPEFSQQKFACEIKRGIATYSSGEAAAAALTSCLQASVAEIPPAQLSWTPIFVEATAGMRLLHLSDPSLAQDIVESVSQTVDGFGFDTMESDVSILPGSLEGAYGWVTASQLSGDLLGALKGSTATFGALDLGGASTQITFPPPPGAPVRAGDLFTATLYGQPVSLYTHSYLCLGMAMLTLQYQAWLIAHGNESVLASPCHPSGYSIALAPADIDDIIASPCATPYRLAPVNASITLTGTSNVTACDAIVSTILAPYRVGESQPTAVSQFLAFGNGYMFLFDFLCGASGLLRCTLAGQTWRVDLSGLDKAVDGICNMSVDALAKLNPGGLNNNSGVCLNGKHVQQLYAAYGFTSATQLQVLQPSSDESIGWAMGYVLVQNSMLEADSGPRDFSGGGYVGAVVVCGVVLCVTLVLMAVLVRRRMARRRDTRASGIQGERIPLI